MSTILRIEAVSGSGMVVGTRRVEPGAGLVFAAALRLALDPTRGLERVELRELLWPGVDPATSANRLRWLLAKLRAIGVPIQANGGNVSLAAGTDVSIDIDDPGACVVSAIGEIFRGYHPTFSAPFAAWLDEQRSILGAKVIRHLLPRLNATLEQGDAQAALDLAAAIHRIDPLNPAAALATAEAACRLGARDDAVQGLQRFLDEIGPAHAGEQLQAKLLLRRIRAAEDARQPTQPKFVGRADQLRRIDSFLASARAHRGGALVVAGPAGIGKTRLLEETHARAIVSGMHVARISCQSVDASRPLAGVADLAMQLIEMPGAAGTDPAHLDQLRDFVSTRRASSSGATTDLTSAQAMRARLVGALLDLLGAISTEAPLLVALDDAQWIDPSLEWLWRSLLEWSKTRAVAWLFAIRRTNRTESLFSLPAIDVGSLELHAAGELLDDLAVKNGRPLTEETRQAILTRAGGNPLFVRELARQWAASGSVEGLPTSLAAVIDNGLLTLSSGALRTLQVAAIFGTHATLARMESTGPLPSADFVEALIELEANGVLTTDRSGATCGHVLWAEAALSQLAASIALVMHRRVAERFESELVAHPNAVLIWEAARHWEFACDPERARAAILRGAEHLFDNGFPSEAAAVYERAIRGLADQSQRAALQLRVIDCLEAAGVSADLVRAIDEHETLAGELDFAYDRHNDLELRRHDAKMALDFSSALLELPLRCMRDRTCTPSHRLHAARLAAKAAELIAPELLPEIHDVAASVGASAIRDRWNLLRVQYIYERRQGDVRRMHAVAEVMVSVARETLPPVELGRALQFLAEACVMVGRFADARRAFAAAISLGRKIGSVEITGGAYDHAIGMSLETDGPEVTRRLMDDARNAWRSLAGFGSQTIAEVTEPGHVANLAVLEGQYAEALRLSRPLDQCLACPVPLWRARLLAIHLAARMVLGMTAGLDEIAKSMAIAFDHPGDWMDWPATIYAEYLSRYQDPSRAREFVAHYVQHIRRELYPAPPSLSAFLSTEPVVVPDTRLGPARAEPRTVELDAVP